MVPNTEPFWSAHQPGVRFTDHEPGTAEFFWTVEQQRYALEPHIPQIVDFARWRDRDVLEVGCGMATDGINFARAGARYTGVDQSQVALNLARQRFEQARLTASFVESQADPLPFPDHSFDLVYSHGVIHHMENTAGAIREFDRVLRPGGTALVMLYHRHSLNYWITIMTVRRALAGLLLIPGMPRIVATLTGERASLLAEHRALLKLHGLRYLTDRQVFLSNNTDGPANPLSKVYTRADAAALFTRFRGLEFTVRNLNLRLYPGGHTVARTRLAARLERHFGWHLYVSATKRTDVPPTVDYEGSLRGQPASSDRVSAAGHA